MEADGRGEQDNFEDATDTATAPGGFPATPGEQPGPELQHDVKDESVGDKDGAATAPAEMETEVRAQSVSEDSTETSHVGIEQTDGAHDVTAESHQIPVTSTGDTQSAAESQGADTRHTRSGTLDSIPHLPPSLPPRQSTDAPLKGLSGDLPSVAHLPPPPIPEESHPSPPVPTRKVSSPFSWFSRATTIRKTAPSPQREQQPQSSTRRNTASSIATTGSNAEVGLGIIDDRGRSRSPNKNRSSLKDRFHMLRLQEESGIDMTEEEEGEPRQGRPGRAGSVQDNAGLKPPPMARTMSMSAVPASPNTKLPPGTAAGMSVGPAGNDAPVNWDLWQSVVYEGPTAVARTSGEELNQAIASGIPQPIRGVVWQVLAQSKDDDLETLYKELVSKGTDREGRPGVPRTESINGAHEKESLTSSASSVHSEASTPATSAMTGSPLTETADAAAKFQATLDKRKLAKDDPVALQKLEKTIRRDLGARTSYSKYVMSAGLQDGLFGLCKAYALFDEAVGYAQGMNFIAMPLLFYMAEEEAFTLLIRLMWKYNLRSMFTAEMPGLHLHLYQFERLLEDCEPALYCHLHRRGVSPNLYATQWFLTLFAYRFPLQLVLRIYDLIFSEGLSAILRFGIVLMQKNAQTLLSMRDMSQLTTHLKERLFDAYIDKSPSASSLLESGFFGSTSGIDKEVYRADDLVRDACALDLKPEALAAYAAEFDEKNRSERERELELESLRAANTTLTTRVRGLEERAQQHDTEHVGIASELVRTKVENEALQDANESLKMQVQELRKMVEAQPAEVEARLQNEMDRIMARNIEVQSENRALEEAAEEVERELVGTKLMFAQLNAEHDALKQKLATVQNMLAGK